MLKPIVAIFFLWSVVDRIRGTFNRGSFRPKDIERSEKLHSLLIIAVYTAIALAGLFGFLFYKGSISLFLPTAGVLLYFTARLLRNNAVKALGTQWNNHTSANPISHVITLGPFAYTRHPYYCGTFLDLIAYALLFASFRTALLAVMAYLPLLLHRLYVEERNLMRKFPQAYGNYKANVGIMFSFKKFFGDLDSLKDVSQLFDIIRRFGINQLVRIRNMSQSVSRYSRGYAVSRIAGALIEIGMIDKLLSQGDVDLIRFCEGNDFDFETLKIVSDYFSILGIFEKQQFFYRLTPYGRKVFHDSKGALTLLYAYMPIFESLPDIIRKKKKYGVDIFRRSEFVGQGSNELASLLPFPYAKDILQRRRLNRILDIGCGAGEFLIRFCEENGFVGYGIDISPEVIDAAQKNAKASGLGSRIQFRVGDIHRLDELDKGMKKVDVITFMFVLHEFLEYGREGVVTVLREVRRHFPNKYVLVSEVYRWSVPQLTKHPVPIAEHHLFHKLSKQGLATVKEWRSMFNEAGFECVEEKRFDRAAQAYFFLKA